MYSIVIKYACCKYCINSTSSIVKDMPETVMYNITYNFYESKNLNLRLLRIFLDEI